MADNYLERKMEEHRKGGAMPKHRLTPSGQRPGKILLDFPPQRVYVTNGAAGYGAAIVKALCDAGCRVAFCDADQKAGAATAQRCGAQYHPLDPTDSAALAASIKRVTDSWGPIGLAIACGPRMTEASAAELISACQRTLRICADTDTPSIPESRSNTIVLPAEGIDEKALTTLVIILASPAAENIRSQIFRL